MNEKTLDLLRPLLGGDVEALPLQLPKVAKDVAPLFVLHELGAKIETGTDIFAEADEFVFRKKDHEGRR